MSLWSTLSAVSLTVGALCAIGIAIDLIRHPQRMTVMNFVWPITALYSGPIGLWLYVRLGRPAAREMPKQVPPLSKAALTGSTHCGAGCALGDVVGTFTVFLLGLTIAGELIWAYLVADLIAAWLFGIVFQYFSIVPMRDLSPLEGIKAAIKADTLSIAAFQIGMYASMLLVRFAIAGTDLSPMSA